MRLGLLGPADNNLAGLARAAEFLLNTVKVRRAIYLGADRALETTVESWAESLLGEDAGEDAVWRRGLELALYGSSEAIDEFLKAQHARRRLRALVSLPEGVRTVELLADCVAVLIHDKALLDEDDMLPANLLVYGKSNDPLVKQIGNRWFLTPGKLSDRGGIGVLDDDDGEVTATIYDATGRTTWRDTLAVRHRGRLRVQGNP